ncbi:MAG: CHAT domain-containing protein [Nostocaceae cyanobacterium]|nr:CHAT domain-containing protein [Nostocaceae cyanobacterium]
MDENRRQAYLNLINQLLNCSSGEEAEILNVNSDFIDAGLVQIMEQVADYLANHGDENNATWLRNLAYQLGEVIAHHSAVIQTYEDFLLEVLQATADSNGNAQVVYELLESNTDKLDHILADRLWHRAILALNKTEIDAEYLVTVIANFSNRISEFTLGNKANNIELGIVGYKIVLNVFTHEAFPYEWAKAQSNLGKLYATRILGEKATNIELSIEAYYEALRVYNQEDFPYEWAVTKNNLGVAYRDRIIGDKANNIEQSIDTLQAALIVRNYDDYPYEWAMTQYNLGLAYIERIYGDKANNIDKGIATLKAALAVQTCDEFPIDWSITQNALGLAYEERIQGEKAQNIEQSIAAYKATLTIKTQAAFPVEWAQTQYNLGNAYGDRKTGCKANNIEQSIAAYKAALSVRTLEAFPYEWAQTQHNLGNAYCNRIIGEEPENNLLALEAFKASVDGAEFLREQIISGYGTKQQLAEDWNQSYINIVEIFLKLGKPTEAIEYAERSKTRNLVELILTRDTHTIFPPGVVTQLEKLRDEIASKQYQLQTATAENPISLAQHLQQLRQQRNELQDKYIRIGSSFEFKQFQTTLDDHTAVVEFYITGDKFLVFIFTRHTEQPIVWQSQPQDLEKLQKWVSGYLRAYQNHKRHWQRRLTTRLDLLAKILHIDEIIQRIPKECDRLILIPHRYLHLLPLHALPLAKGDFLCDRFFEGVSYAPSCQLLQLTQQRDRPNFSNLFAIQNPTQDLFYTNLEVEAIRSFFCSTEVLAKQAATKTALSVSQNFSSAHCSHFSCHGEFNLASPLESALILANKERLTLGEVFGLNLNQCRLITLSACETGLTDPYSISDEYIGLPSGFLYAGSSSVVSSLWTVNDLSTSLLMIKFYENLRQSENLEEGDVAIALNQAQKWLRNLTLEDFDLFLEQYKPQIEKILAKLRPGQRSLFKESLKQIRQRQPLPFANPYYWAAFTATGI